MKTSFLYANYERYVGMKMKAFAHTRRRVMLFATLAFSVTAFTGISPVWAAGITYTPTSPVLVNQTVTFTGSCSLGPCQACGWAFGDGGTSSASCTINHSYSNAGTYTVSLHAVNANGDLEPIAYATVTVVGVFFEGHVYDNSNAPISGATVDLRSQDGNTLYGRVSTDSNGYYQIGGPGTGTFQVNATKASYWEERQYVTVSCGGCIGTGDFHIPGDLFYPVATLLATFDSVNTQQTVATLSWSLAAGSTTEVDGYLNPLGINAQVSADFLVTGSSNTTANPSLTSFLEQRGVEVHGIFWKQNPSQPLGVWVVAQQNIFGEDTTMQDPMTSPPQSGGFLQNVNAHTSFSFTATQSASASLRAELGVDVSVSLEGVGFSTKLASILVQQSGTVQRSVTIAVNNVDSVTHAYYFFFENGGVLHVWQVN
jgi:PKD repeat protein